MARLLVYLGFVLTLGVAAGGWDIVSELGGTEAAMVVLELDSSIPLHDFWAVISPFLSLPLLLLAVFLCVPLPANSRLNLYSVVDFLHWRAPPATPV